MGDALTAPVSSKRRAKFIVGGAVVCCALIGLVTWAMLRPQATLPYLKVSEIKTQGVTPPAEELRVNGFVVPETVERRGLTTDFRITDGSDRLRVTTDQALPEAFWVAMREDSSRVEVIAQGRYDGDDFTASQVFAKCPSKFKARV
ncbi:MAG: cytochrome c maturation protein CcmE [Actinomycetota bacterium]